MRHPHRNRPAARLLSVVTVAVAALGLALSAPATAAFAGDPVELSGRYVLDDAGVLGGDEAAVQDAIDTLATEHGVNLFVVYTDRFTNPSDREQWASEVADLNQFGTNDVLLAVAVDDRLYQLSVDSGFALSDAQLAAIESDDIVPQLRDEDWAGAGVAAAEGIGAALGGSGGGSGTQTGGGFGGLVWVLAVLIIVVVAALVAVVIIRRRRSLDTTATEQAVAAGPTQKELDQRVGAMLIDLDDAVTTSQQELGFAVAQFGEQATAPFAEVLGRVKASLSEAFALKQKLDDAVPDTAEERRAWSEKIIALCDAASDELDEQTEAFDALRDLERNPGPVLEATRTALAGLATAEESTRQELAALAHDYDAAALATVSGSLTQAESLRTFADTKLGEAASSLATGATAEAALDIRAAQQAVAQVSTLSDAVSSLRTDLAQA
ncbi:MAG: TPM domain-containing protein, partial [Herbiconiux sp.]|nr:TPM domain-containing protein [Herbiconiux sp.]